MADANPFGALGDRSIEDFRGRTVGKLPQEVVFHCPEVLEADLIRQRDLGHDLFIAVLLNPVIVGFRDLDFIHESELHGPFLPRRYGLASTRGWVPLSAIIAAGDDTPRHPRPGPQRSITSWSPGAWPSPISRATVCVVPSRVATPPIFQESPALLVLVEIDVAMRVDPDGMPAIPRAGTGRTRPARQHLPIEG